MLQIDEVSEPGAIDGLSSEWRALVARMPDATPFQTWEWCATWWKHHGHGKPFILRAHDSGHTVGLMPLVISRWRGTPLRQVRFFGAPLSDYQAPIVEPAHAEACVRAFLERLYERRARWDLCDFADQREGSPLTLASAGGLAIGKRHHRACPVIVLPKTYDEYVSTLSKNTRTNLGRRRRQIGKQFKAEYATANEGDLQASMEALFRLHNARWRRRGAMGAFSGARMQAFHQEVARAFLERGWLKLHLLRLDGEIRAAFYCFAYGGRVYYYLSGFDLALSKFSIGNVAMGAALADAIASGAREFDLLRGDESYKFQWNAVERSTERLIVTHAGVRSRLAGGAHAVERYLEHEGLKLQRRLWGRERKRDDDERKRDDKDSDARL